MRNKKILALGLSIALVAITPASHAKKIFPSDIMARDLNYPGMGIVPPVIKKIDNLEQTIRSFSD